MRSSLPDLDRSGSWIGVAAVVVAGFLYGYLAVAAPGWLHSGVLPLVWVAALLLACAWFVRHPYRVLGVAVAVLGCWFVVVLS